MGKYFCETCKLFDDDVCNQSFPSTSSPQKKKEKKESNKDLSMVVDSVHLLGVTDGVLKHKYPLMKVNDNCVDMDFVLVTWSYFSPVVNTHDIFYISNSY